MHGTHRMRRFRTLGAPGTAFLEQFFDLLEYEQLRVALQFVGHLEVRRALVPVPRHGDETQRHRSESDDQLDVVESGIDLTKR